MSNVPFDDLGAVFTGHGTVAGLDALIEHLKKMRDHHGLFRATLLKKRYEMGLPLINPGELKNVSDDKRKEYEDFVEQTCRETGAAYLEDGNILQAWRYFRTIGENGPVRAAIEKIKPADATDDIIGIALDEGVHPQRGFQLLMEKHGICRAISVFDRGFSDKLEDKRAAAGMLVRSLYADLVRAIRKKIFDKFNEIPPETDLVDLVRHRPWLFEKGYSYADPTHVAAVARIGLLTEAQDELIMTLSICEYGRMLPPQDRPEGRPPFEATYDDQALYARALLGQNVDSAVEHFRTKLSMYAGTGVDTSPAELTVLLLWRLGQKHEALHVWQHYLAENPPEAQGAFIQSYYELCIQAGEFYKLAETARSQGDTSAWAAAHMMAAEGSKASAAPAAVAPPEPS